MYIVLNNAHVLLKIRIKVRASRLNRHHMIRQDRLISKPHHQEACYKEVQSMGLQVAYIH